MSANPHRLERSIAPVRYDVTLVPDLGAARFTGTVDIELRIDDETDTIVGNAAELTIDDASLLVGGQVVALVPEVDEAYERMSFTLPRPLAAGSTATLRLAFTGILNDKLRGFYRSTFTDDEGRERVIATTQMQATDCRRAFPCWDEPDFKAVFGVTLVVDDGLFAISNGPEVSREPRPEGKVAIRFADTMPMSSYLVAFVVGPLEATEAIDVEGVPLRVVHVPGKAHLTGFALETGAHALRWFQRYYDLAYPGEKVDHVALPDFAAGAMENLGCITYRESLLLVDPESATQTEQSTVADVICHEVAHMWFGDLVTMRWWNGIWLNEAFATFMEVAAANDFRPDWKRWETFSLERTVAFETDSLRSTRPVEYEVVSPADADGMFDVLTYLKGGSLLRMLEQHLGEERFRDGIRHYLRRHAHANTETGDLWDALEEVTGEPVRRTMDSWIWQPGYPLVSARVDGDDLVVDQRRFLFGDEPDATLWSIPIQVRQTSGGASQEARLLLEGEQTRLALLSPDAVVVVNSGGNGFFRVTYDEALRTRLQGDALRQLSTVERYNLVDDAWAAVVAGESSAVEYLELVRGFADETELPVWRSILGGLGWCDRLVDGPAREGLQTDVRGLVGPRLAELGWEPSPDNDDLTRELRGLLIRAAAVLGADEASQVKARTTFDAMDGSSTDPAVAAAVVSVVAAAGGDDLYDLYVERYRTSANPQEQLRYLYALADFPSAEQMARTLDLAIGPDVKTQNAPYLLARCIANRDLGDQAWRFVREHWAHANDAFPGSSIVRMIDPVKTLVRPEQQADVAGFFAEHDIPQARQTLQQVLERQRVNVQLRARESGPLAESLGT